MGLDRRESGAQGSVPSRGRIGLEMGLELGTLLPIVLLVVGVALGERKLTLLAIAWFGFMLAAGVCFAVSMGLRLPMELIRDWKSMSRSDRLIKTPLIALLVGMLSLLFVAIVAVVWLAVTGRL